MKSILLLLFACVPSFCLGQATIFENIPANGSSVSSYRAPNGTSSHGSFRAHYIIPASELSALPSGIDITTVAFNLVKGTNTTANGNLKFYMENTTATSNTKSSTWSVAITGMVKVFDGTFNVPISNGAIDAPLALTDTFNYTGAGIHIAYEYIGSTFSTIKAKYSCNNSISNSLFMTSNSSSIPGTILGVSSSYRPMLTVEYLNPFSNDMVVDNLTLEYGHHNKINDTNQTVTGIVRNKSSVSLSYVSVKLTVTGANPTVKTQTINYLPAGSSYPLTFSNLTTTASGIQTVTLSVPPDQYTSNDSLQIVQTISCDTLSYFDNSIGYSSIGFDEDSGIIAVKHLGSTNKNTSVKAIYANIGGNTNITGNQLQAVLLDSGRNIIDSSVIFTVTASQLGTKVVFPLTGDNVIPSTNPEYYIGIKQYPNTTTGYYPIESHRPVNVPTDRYFILSMDGSIQLASRSTSGTYGIGALIEVEGITLINSDANDSICDRENITFTASGTSSVLYNFKSGGTSLQNTSSNTYTSYINATTSITVEGMHNNCHVFSDTSTINLVLVNTNVSKTNDSTVTALSSGASYQWIDCGNDIAIPGANSQTFVALVSGNYKVIVTQNGCSDTSVCYSLVIPVAGIDEHKIESLKIYPSPVSSVLTVETDFIQIKTLTIRDIGGRIIATYTPYEKKVELDVSNFTSGIYLIQVASENGREIRRFIKN